MTNVSKKVVMKIKTRFTYLFVLFLESRAVCEMMWKNMVEPGRPQMTIWPMRFACWIRYKHTIFPLQQWQHQRALLLRSTYIACLVKY